MRNTIIVGDGNHYENAKAWIMARVGDLLEMPNGNILKLQSKNPKSAVCIDVKGETKTVAIKALLPNGSDKYVNLVVRNLQDQLINESGNDLSFIDESDMHPITEYKFDNTMQLARRIIRVNGCSTNPKKDIAEYLSSKLTSTDKKLSAEQQSIAAKIAVRHLLGDMPCPMSGDNYSAAEWVSYDSWFFNHHKTKKLVVIAKAFDEYLLKRLGDKVYRLTFGLRKAKSALEKSSSLKSCLHSWFMNPKERSLKSMSEAYRHLQSRIDFQSNRMEFILTHSNIFSSTIDPQALTDLLINSTASDLLKPLLVGIHGIEFGHSSRSVIPQFCDLQCGRVNINDIKASIHQRDIDDLGMANSYAKKSSLSILKVTSIIENIESTHLPFINRKLSEAGCKKLTRSSSSTNKAPHYYINCESRILSLPVCEGENVVIVAKQYFSLLADLINPNSITKDELDNAIDQAHLKATCFIESFNG